MHEIFQPARDKKKLVEKLYGLMSDVLSPIAHYLMAQPVGDNVAGPTFEVYEFEGSPWDELLEIGERVAEGHPALDSVVTAVKAL